VPTNSEVFYLHVSGEQRGPYTTRQIDHQLNSGIIDEETLYWREGMDQWQPVTDLVPRRSRKPPAPRRWARRLILLALLVPAALLGRVFGPIAVVGWRETAQYDFSATAAYWRARDVIRRQVAPTGAVITFSRFSESRVELVTEPPGAHVWLKAEIVPLRDASRKAAWEVTLDYSRDLKEWTGRELREESP
jgi:hypothetical protein